MLPIAQAFVLRWVLMGGISTNHFLAWLSWLCPGASTAVCALSLWGVWVVGNVSGVWLVGVVFGALLGPEATGPFCSNAKGALLVFLFVPAAGSFLLFGGWVWLMGLLFENYIVDASIWDTRIRVCVPYSNFL